MGTSTDDLKKRYSSLSDSELIELYKAGGLTDEATSELSKQLAERGLDRAKIDDIEVEQSKQQKQEYLTSSPKPFPKIWIGFVIAAAGLIAEFFDSYAGFDGRFGTATLFFIVLGWLGSGHANYLI